MPVCLPFSPKDPGQSPSLKDSATVVGFGRISNDREESTINIHNVGASTNLMNKLVLKVQSDEDCAFQFENLNPRTQLCAGGVLGSLIQLYT